MATATVNPQVEQDDLLFDEEDHSYKQRSTGKIYPSSTQVIAAVGLCDFSMIKKEVLDNKRWIGIETHKACHYLDENDLDLAELERENPVIYGYVCGYKAFKEATNFQPRMIEKKMIACVAGVKYGMTMDREGVIQYGGKTMPCIIELKCTSSMEDYWSLQTSSYDLGLGPAPEKVKRIRAAVQLKPDGTFKVATHDDSNDHNVFMAALAVTNWKLNHGYKIK